MPASAAGAGGGLSVMGLLQAAGAVGVCRMACSVQGPGPHVGQMQRL